MSNPAYILEYSDSKYHFRISLRAKMAKDILH